MALLPVMVTTTSAATGVMVWKPSVTTNVTFVKFVVSVFANCPAFRPMNVVPSSVREAVASPVNVNLLSSYAALVMLVT